MVAYQKLLLATTAMAGGVMLLSAAEPAMAQDGADRSSGNLDVITVTAQKREESLQQVPIAVTAVAGDVLVNTQINMAENLDQLTPGLNINRNANFVGFFLRGVGTIFANPGLEPSVASYFDDAYMPRTATSMFAFSDIERIEVLKGPQGTLYGRNAAGGAIRIITKQPTFDVVEGNASITYGRFDRVAADGAVNIPLSENLAARFSAVYDSNDGYVENISPDFPNQQDRNVYHFLGKLLWEPTDRLSVKLSGDIGRKKDREGQAFIALEQTGPLNIAAALGGTVAPGFFTASQDYPNDDIFGSEFDTRNRGAAFRADYDLDFATLSSISTYRYYWFRGGADLDTTDIPFQHALTDGENSKSFSQELQLTSNTSGPLQYVAGLYYYRERSQSRLNILGTGINGQLGLPPATVAVSAGEAPTFFAQADIEVDSIAPYLQATYDITDQIAFTGGIRYTNETKKQPLHTLTLIVPGAPDTLLGTEPPAELNFDKFTPKFVLDYKPVDNVLLYASWSRGFKAGGINAPTFNFPADQVDSENLDSYEIGWKTEFNNIRFNGAAFYYDYTNLQVTTTNTNLCGGACVSNAATAEVWGVEADILWAPLDNLEFAAAGAYLNSEFNEYLGDSFVPASGTPECAAALATPDPADDAACLGFAIATDTDFSGNPLPQTPEFSGYVRMSYTHDLADLGDIRLDALYSYTDPIFFGPDPTYGANPEKHLLTATLTYTLPNENLYFSVFGENLTDERYITQSGRQQTGGWQVPGAPRTWGVKAGVRF